MKNEHHHKIVVCSLLQSYSYHYQPLILICNMDSENKLSAMFTKEEKEEKRWTDARAHSVNNRSAKQEARINNELEKALKKEQNAMNKELQRRTNMLW